MNRCTFLVPLTPGLLAAARSWRLQRRQIAVIVAPPTRQQNWWRSLREDGRARGVRGAAG